MKKTLFLIIAIISFGFINSIVAQEVEVPLHQPIHPIKGDTHVLGFTYEKQKKYSSSIQVYENTTVLVGYLEQEIVEVKVQESRTALKVSPVNTERSSGLIARYLVTGHSKGKFYLNFADANGFSTAGPQKNRRVEMTIEFD
ncbi:MAG: hypothetical protein AAF502_16355 [Bacteroidota bacterium]